MKCSSGVIHGDHGLEISCFQYLRAVWDLISAHPEAVCIDVELFICLEISCFRISIDVFGEYLSVAPVSRSAHGESEKDDQDAWD